MYRVCVSGAHRGQRRALDLPELELDSFEPPCRYWELNASPRAASVFSSELSPAPVFNWSAHLLHCGSVHNVLNTLLTYTGVLSPQVRTSGLCYTGDWAQITLVARFSLTCSGS